jgi:subtilisin-like proprotein convertase family protein
MKKYLLIGLLVLGAMMSSQAAVYSLGNVNGSGTALNTTIPDDNPNGITSQITVNGSPATAYILTDITVTLNVSGGYNGDLYAYLSYNGTLVTLLNRVGENSSNPFGSADSGFNNVTLNSTGSDVHLASAGGGALSGTYAADGRQISPLSSAASFNAGGTVTLDGSFAGMNPNGTWTLFLGDFSAGDTSTLNGWSLNVTAIPEPVDVALAIFGVCVAGVSAGRFYLRRRRSAKAV